MAGNGRRDGKSGRKKGTPNKSTLPLIERANEVGVDPFQILLMFAKGDWKGLGYNSPSRTMYSKSGESYEVDLITLDHRLKAASEACQYLHPKRKAIEVIDEKNLSEDPCADYTDEELDEL